MNAEFLQRAVTEDTKEVLKPVVQIAYQTIPASKIDVLTVANETNKALGYELFDDLYYPSLVRDISIVARAVAMNAMKSS